MTKVRVDFSNVRKVNTEDEFVDCPNPMCDCECNVCMGSGEIANPYYRFGDEEGEEWT